jgi:hypothetical protein
VDVTHSKKTRMRSPPAPCLGLSTVCCATRWWRRPRLATSVSSQVGVLLKACRRLLEIHSHSGTLVVVPDLVQLMRAGAGVKGRKGRQADDARVSGQVGVCLDREVAVLSVSL